jgi:type IV secretion system protein VirB2
MKSFIEVLKKSLHIFALLFAIVAFAPTAAIASDQDPKCNAITKTMCNVIEVITSGVGKSIAILIIISLAIALFLGKVSWGLAIATGVGMGLLFGATDIINLITPDGESGDFCQAVKDCS